MYTFVRTHGNVHLKCMLFTICKSHLNDVDFKTMMFRIHQRPIIKSSGLGPSHQYFVKALQVVIICSQGLEVQGCPCVLAVESLDSNLIPRLEDTCGVPSWKRRQGGVSKRENRGRCGPIYLTLPPQEVRDFRLWILFSSFSPLPLGSLGCT